MAEAHEQEEQAEHPEPHATMDMGEHLRTWRLFVAFFKWHIVGLGVLLLLLLMFRAHG